MNNIKTWTMLLAALLIAGCSNQTTQQPTVKEESPKPLESLTEVQQQQRGLAIAAKDKLFQSLLGELMGSIQTNGVASSIEVCKTKAPELARSISEDMQLRIGRTSFQLRSTENQPPSWAESFVSDRVANEVNVSLADESLGVLLPIPLKEACIKCHGPADAIVTEVASAITKHYPDDKATGFAEGDVRGYFWVEVPAIKDSTN